MHTYVAWLDTEIRTQTMLFCLMVSYGAWHESQA